MPVDRSKIHANHKNHWETPQWFFDYLDGIFEFKVDLFASKSNAKCKKYFCEDDTPLHPNAMMHPIRDWFRIDGWSWANPPYGSGIEDIVRNAAEQSLKGFRGVFLLPHNSSSQWYHRYVEPYARITILEGRLQFEIDGKRPKRIDPETGEEKSTGNSGANVLAVYPRWVCALPPRLSLAAIKREVKRSR